MNGSAQRIQAYVFDHESQTMADGPRIPLRYWIKIAANVVEIVFCRTA
jgi:hypothetical protein